jgi:NAD(P)H-hydrate epimerase
MQTLKLQDFSLYTKKVIGSRYAYAIRENAESLGFDDRLQVENAGFAIANIIKRTHKGSSVLIICGQGGKGGVGLALARHMIGYADVTACFVGRIEDADNQTTKLNYRLLGEISDIIDVHEGEEAKLEEALGRADIAIDALIGIGLRGRAGLGAARAISLINRHGKHVISIDIPSGIDPDTGAARGAYVKSDELLTLHKLKAGIATEGFTGSTVVVDICMPLSAELLAGPGDLSLAIEPRRIGINKYSAGGVLIVGGGEHYHGAPLLASNAAQNAIAALRTAVGYATIFVPKGKEDVVRGLSQNAIVRGYDGEELSVDSLGFLSGVRHNVTIIGPGLGKSETVCGGVRALVERENAAKNLIVIDGDAIGAISKHKNLLGRNVVLTPHHGEFTELTGVDSKNATLGQLARRAISFAKAYNCVIALKGHETIITDGNLLKVNIAKSSALATMGTGDVLSGIIAAYLASHKDVFESTVAGVYLHSLVGDALNERMGPHILASDVVDSIPAVLKGIGKDRELID